MNYRIGRQGGYGVVAGPKKSNPAFSSTVLTKQLYMVVVVVKAASGKREYAVAANKQDGFFVI
jgi:hypothetical protein